MPSAVSKKYELSSVCVPSLFSLCPSLGKLLGPPAQVSPTFGAGPRRTPPQQPRYVPCGPMNGFYARLTLSVISRPLPLLPKSCCPQARFD